MIRSGFFALVTLIASFLLPSLAIAAEPAWLEVRPRVPGSMITGLQFDIDASKLREPSPRGGGWVLELRGTFLGQTEGQAQNKSNGASLLLGNVPIAVQPDSTFVVLVPMKTNPQPLPLALIGVSGIPQPVDYWVRVAKSAFVRKPVLRYQPFSVGLGGTLIQYRDTRVSAFSETAITLRASVGTFWKTVGLDARLSGYYTLLPLSHTGNYAAKFLGINLRFERALRWLPDPWRLGLAFGGYYATMSVDSDAFGYINVGGPQLYPTLRRQFANGSMGVFYFKFSPVSANFSLLQLASREIAAGITYVFPQHNGRSFSVSFDISDMQLQIDGDHGSSSTISLSAAYSL